MFRAWQWMLSLHFAITCIIITCVSNIFCSKIPCWAWSTPESFRQSWNTLMISGHSSTSFNLPKIMTKQIEDEKMKDATFVASFQNLGVDYFLLYRCSIWYSIMSFVLQFQSYQNIFCLVFIFNSYSFDFIIMTKP